MQSLNKKERGAAYKNFLLLYIITTALIVTGIYFGTRVPLRQNKMMQGQIAGFERERLFNSNFSEKMKTITQLLDSVNKPGVQSNLIDGQMDQKLSQMTALVESDSTSGKPLYQQVVKVLYDRKDDKNQLRLSANTASTSADKDKVIAELKSKITEYSTALTACQNQVVQLSR